MTIRCYVRVIAVFDPDGFMRPIRLELPDGSAYRIDRLLGLKKRWEMKSGGTGDRFTISIRGRESYLYFQPSKAIKGPQLGRWFIEQDARNF